MFVAFEQEQTSQTSFTIYIQSIIEKNKNGMNRGWYF